MMSERVAFVSRRSAAKTPQPEQSEGEVRGPLPHWREPIVLGLLLLTVALQGLSWLNMNGYQLADSVEFMERARTVVLGQPLDTTHAVRSFGFSTLLLPIFALAEWLDLGEMRFAVHAVRLLQMLLGLGLVYSTMRLGARLGGKGTGLVSGFLISVNPIFLQYSVDPVSGVAAAYFVAASLNQLIARRGFLPSVGGGLLMGVAFMMAYQILMIAVPLLALLVLRDRTKWQAWGGALIGLAVAFAAQIVLDKITYDTWGMSISTYLLQNGGGVIFSVLSSLGLQDQEWVKNAYDSFAAMAHDGVVSEAGGEARSLQSRFYYLDNLADMWTLPAQALAAFGLLRCLRRMNWMSSILLVLVLLNAFTMSFKGAKSFRLWLPLLPLIAPLCALGWNSLVRANSPTRPRWRVMLGALVLVGALGTGVVTLHAQNSGHFGAYWDAMDFVNKEIYRESERAPAKGTTAAPQVIGAAYDWAIFCRDDERGESLKLRWALDGWETLDETQRHKLISQLEELDWFILHGTILRIDPVLTGAINDRFEVVSSFWDPRTSYKIRDVRVLRRLRTESEATGTPPKRLWQIVRGMEPEEYRRKWNLEREMPSPALMLGDAPDGSQERLQLLGFSFEPIGNAGFSWLTYHWYTDTGFGRDYTLSTRVSTLQCPWSWEMNSTPAHGALPTTTWEAGTILRESYLFVPGSHAFLPDRFKPIGGSYRRGSELPAMLWVRGQSPPPRIMDHVLVPADWKTGARLRVDEAQVATEEFGLRTPLGYIVSGDGLFRVGRFPLPVHDSLRWPDDGTPGPDDAEIQKTLATQRREIQRREAMERSKEMFGSEGDG